MLVWFEFALCLVLIAVAGYRLSLYGDMIAEKLQLSRSWIGVLMVASVTSLPELRARVCSLKMKKVPDIANAMRNAVSGRLSAGNSGLNARADSGQGSVWACRDKTSN